MKHRKNLALLLPILAILAMPLVSTSQNCEKVKIADFPRKDLPSAYGRAHLKQEASDIYYYGIGAPIDYVKARKLAFIEWEKDSEKSDPFGGASMLMMLYANGFGVKRNLDISIRLACANVIGAGAEMEGRVQHLKDMKAGKSTEIFDVCDDLTSGYLEGMCQSLHSELAEIKRKSTTDSVIKKWPKRDLDAYKKLCVAASPFFYERVNSEVDESGTARVAMVWAESDALEDDFLDKIIKADKCTFEHYSAADFLQADKDLNALYSKIMNNKAFEFGTVTKEGIKAAQRKWIPYRDAWVAFGAVRCPGVTDISWKTMVTQERVEQLKVFVDE